MNQKVLRQLTEALRSGKYIKATGRLMKREAPDAKPSHCVMGVLVDLAVNAGVMQAPRLKKNGEWDMSPWALPAVVAEWAGVHSELPLAGGRAYEHNDGRGYFVSKSFEELADMFEAEYAETE